ncbi:hypothetical protein CCP4SC76_1720002 [Gammaproteobacteria bacterium]
MRQAGATPRAPRFLPASSQLCIYDDSKVNSVNSPEQIARFNLLDFGKTILFFGYLSSKVPNLSLWMY